MSASEVLDREFLEMRALILQLAASFDRIDRSKSPAAQAEKLRQLQDGVKILLDDSENKAKQVQMLFSNPYAQDWAARFGLTDPRVNP